LTMADGSMSSVPFRIDASPDKGIERRVLTVGFSSCSLSRSGGFLVRWFYLQCTTVAFCSLLLVYGATSGGSKCGYGRAWCVVQGSVCLGFVGTPGVRDRWGPWLCFVRRSFLETSISYQVLKVSCM
jgi:hypothetical protein